VCSSDLARIEQMMLEKLGYHVTARTSSVEALKEFKANPFAFDLVLTDMTMPSITGIQLADALFSIRRDIPVIICTGFSEKTSEEKAKANGINGFLMKPVVKSDMAKMVRKVLDSAKQ
jgi:CheY-like chemotaxis protein